MVGTYQERLGALLRLPWRPDALHEFCLGQAGIAHAVLLAEQWLNEERYERVVILATDSYLDGSSLEWLLAHRRLKTPERPVGLMPGEAGACLLLESQVNARQRKAPLLAIIESTAIGHAPKDPRSPNPGRAVGEDLARVTAQCISSTSLESRFTGDILIDLNGEDWRAREWGHAQVRLSNMLSERTRPVIPCTSIGDVGAASGAVGACVAVRSFARKYSLSRHTLVLSSSENGDVGAMCLRAPGERS
jgi:3-oxoacyl-[acyl-carrier-protein] synthase-1